MFLLYYKSFVNLTFLLYNYTLSSRQLCVSQRGFVFFSENYVHHTADPQKHDIAVSPFVFNEPGNLCCLLLHSFFQGGTSVPLKSFPDISYSSSTFYKVFPSCQADVQSYILFNLLIILRSTSVV